MKAIFLGVLLASTIAAGSTAAQTTVPALSGIYIVDYNEVCQGNTNTGNGGASHSEIFTVKFDPTTGKVKLTGTDVSGALMVMGGGVSGYQQTPISGSGGYSNTATTVTLGGTTFNVLYGSVKNGVAQSAVFNGVATGNCAASAIAVRQ